MAEQYCDCGGVDGHTNDCILKEVEEIVTDSAIHTECVRCHREDALDWFCQVEPLLNDISDYCCAQCRAKHY